MPALPLWAIFAVILVLGLVASLGGGVRWGLLNEILAKDGYLLGRSVFNMANGITQIARVRDRRRPHRVPVPARHAAHGGGPVR